MGTFSLEIEFAGRPKYRGGERNSAMIIFRLNDQLTWLV
jgi:hypothetical protein